MEISKIIKFLYSIKTSLLIFLLVAFFYFSISEGRSFIPAEEILKYSFSVYGPENSFLFIFVHESLQHLFENLFAFLAYAIVIELALGAFDVIAIFFLSAIAAALVYVAVNANAAMLGASTGVMGLAAAAFFLNLKRAILFSAAMLLFVYFIAVPVISGGVDAQQQNIEFQKQEISGEIEIAKSAGDIERQQVLERQILVVEQESLQIEEGKGFAEKTETSNFAHGLGAFFGLAYLFVFRRDRFEKASHELHGILMGILKAVGVK